MNNPGYVIYGSFGVDESGGLRDERDRRLVIVPQSMMGDVLTHRLPVLVQHDVRLYDADAKQVGSGSQAIAALWDGDRVIGCLSADNLFEGGQMDSQQCELLGLYAAVLGHLSSRKRAEEALRLSEEKYRALTESTNDLVYSADTEGRLTYISPQVAQYGWRSEEMVSRDLLDFVDPQDRRRVAQEFQETMTTGREFPSELRIVDASGQAHWVEDHGKVRRDPGGKVVGLTGILRDITDRKRAEQAAQAAHRKLTGVREQERRRLARELHDSLGQQLIGLQLALENARTETDSHIAARAGALLGRVTDGFGELIREVRRISYGLYPPTLESLGLCAALSRLAQDVTPLIGAELRCPPELMEARFDAETEIALFRIAQEAVNNAVRHSGARSIRIDLERTDSQVFLTVADDGEGFDTSEVAGRGLGLVAMAERAAAVGGGVEISSRRGETCIRVHAPAKPPEDD